MRQSWQIRQELEASFRAGKLRDIAYRKEQILQVAYMIKVCRYSERSTSGVPVYPSVDEGCV